MTASTTTTTTTASPPRDGVRAPAPREAMSAAVRRLRDTYEMVPGAPLYRREFGYYCLDEWKAQGMPQDVPLDRLFDFDARASRSLGQLGWCEAAFVPAFPDLVVEDRGEHEVIQDGAGRRLLVFRGRRSGFMPGYIDHPVKDLRTWERDVLWRLDHGEFDGLHPRWVVVNIGTNNFSTTAHAQANTPAQVAAGIRAICLRIRSKSPDSRIVVMGVLPRGAKADDSYRVRIAELNKLLPELGQVRGVTFLDIGDKFVQPGGELPRSLMGDFCHPTEAGYAIWAAALAPLLSGDR